MDALNTGRLRGPDAQRLGLGALGGVAAIANMLPEGREIARRRALRHKRAMKKADAIDRLKPFERRLRERGISALYLFGSTARDEAGDASDLDLLFETDPAYRFSLFDQAGIMVELSDQLQAKVDFVSRKALKPSIRRHVEIDLVQVF